MGQGRHPLPSRGALRGRRVPCGHRCRRDGRRLRDPGRRRAALVAPPPFRPRRLRRPHRRDRRLGRAARAGHGGGRAGEFVPRLRFGDTISAEDLAAGSATRRSFSSMRALRIAGAASRTSIDTTPAGSPAPSTRRGRSRNRSCPTASSSRTAAPVSLPASCCTGPSSAGAKEGSIRAAGATGRRAASAEGAGARGLALARRVGDGHARLDLLRSRLDRRSHGGHLVGDRERCRTSRPR